MRSRSGPLIAVVAAVAVAGVLAGGVIAARQGRTVQTVGSPAGPFPAGATTPPVSPTAKPTPSPPSSQPAATKVKLALAKLPTGREPQVTHLRGREIRGGAGVPIKVPGKEQITAVGRIGSFGLAILADSQGFGLELVQVSDGPDGIVSRTPGVGSLVTSEDTRSAAYATQLTTKDGGSAKGGTVYFQFEGTGPSKSLKRPADYDLQVLGVANRVVYFRASDNEIGNPWRLYRWNVDEARAVLMKEMGSATAVSSDGTLVTSLSAISDSGTCSAVMEVKTNRRRWRSCDYQLDGFTPDGRTVIAGPAMRDGYADLTAAALDSAAGHLIREWSGLSFRGTVAEDDGHLLMVADDGPETKAAIIRCSISSGQCELTTPLATGEIALGS